MIHRPAGVMKPKQRELSFNGGLARGRPRSANKPAGTVSIVSLEAGYLIAIGIGSPNHLGKVESQKVIRHTINASLWQPSKYLSSRAAFPFERSGLVSHYELDRDLIERAVAEFVAHLFNTGRWY